jgi:hypothetical protein
MKDSIISICAGIVGGTVFLLICYYFMGWL